MAPIVKTILRRAIAHPAAMSLSLAMAGVSLPAEVSAKTGGAAICDQAAQAAARAFPVPLTVLNAVSRTETGRSEKGRIEPWPWTVNMEGAGHWFSSQDEARAFVFRHFKAGARSFDVGCFQINYKWHHRAFESLDDMFDPTENALYAARFLTELHAELGSWDAAVGAYHSRTEKLADRYLRRYRQIHAGLQNEAGRPAVPAPRTAFLTLASGPDPDPVQKPARLGSLALTAASGATPLFSMDSRPAVHE